MPVDPSPDRSPEQTSANSRAPALIALVLVLLAAALFAACDESFTPLAPTAARFSINGYLDVSADTQWIRVMPIRETVPAAPSELDATVVLEHLGSGETIVLRDSLFRFQVGPDVGSEGVFLHNFWTTEPIEPGATYRFTVTSAEMGPAEATVSVPDVYGVEVWINQDPRGRTDQLRLIGLDHLGLFFATAWFTDQCGSMVDRIGGNQTLQPVERTFVVPVSRWSVARPRCGLPEVHRREFFIVGSASEWPAEDDLDPNRLGGPGVVSTVSNAVGFLGGVLTRTVPYEFCRLEGPPGAPHCRLRYDDAMAIVEGTVRDVVCDHPRPGALVELRTLELDEAGYRRVRYATADSAGEFRIEALEGEREYAGRVVFESPDPNQRFREHTDTIRLASAERRTYDVDLERFGGCEVPA